VSFGCRRGRCRWGKRPGWCAQRRSGATGRSCGPGTRSAWQGRRGGSGPGAQRPPQHLGRGEQLIGRHRPLSGTIAGAHSRSLNRDPTPAQGHRTRPMAVPAGHPIPIVLTSLTGLRGDVSFHDRGHHLQFGADCKSKQPPRAPRWPAPSRSTGRATAWSSPVSAARLRRWSPHRPPRTARTLRSAGRSPRLRAGAGRTGRAPPVAVRRPRRRW
jgi:hypothetical protein